MKISLRSVLAASLIVLLFSALPGFAAHSTPASGPLGRSHSRLSFGVGASAPSPALGLSCSLSPFISGGFGSVRLLTLPGFALVEPAEVSGNGELHSATEIGFLYGQQIADRWRHVYAAIGIGYTWGDERILINEYPYRSKCEKFAVVSVPIEVGLFFSPVLPLGVGVVGFGNLNTEQSFGGLLLCLQLRRFKSAIE